MHPDEPGADLPHDSIVSERRRRDSNPRRLRAAVFKTAAFGRSATPPNVPLETLETGIDRRPPQGCQEGPGSELTSPGPVV